MFGLEDSTVTAINIEKANRNREHNVLNLKKGTTDILTQKYIRDLPADYPKLLNKFNSDEDNDKLEVLKSYLEIINEKTANK